MRLRLGRRLRRRKYLQEDANATGFHSAETADFASSNMRRKSEIVGLIREGPWIVWNLLEQFVQDLRYSVRMLRKSPTFASVAVLVLALGIGANTAVFSVISALLMRPLPYENPERLAWIWGNNNQLGVNQGYLSTPDVFAFQQRSSSLESIAAWTTFPRNLVDKDVPERLEGILVTPNFFACLGVRIDLGRDFLPEEVLEGHDEVAIISDALWRRRFGSDPNVVGTRLRFNRGDSNGVLVVGVAPSEVQFPAHADIWMPGVDLSSNFEQGSRDLRAVARLKPGWTMEQAQSELNILTQSLEQEYPATNVGWRVSLTSVRDLVLGTPVKALWLLLGAVICVLLIACANVASLQLARSVSRSREIMLRVAIGASRIRVVRQLLIESFILAVVGGATALLLGWWGVAGLRAVGPATISRLGEAEINGKVLVFTAVVTLMVSIASGLLPALQASRFYLMEALKASPRGSTRSVGRTRMRSLLAAVEVAAATLLLIGAGLLLKSFWRLQGVDPGFNADHVLTAGISLDLYFMNSDERRTGIFTQVLERVRGLPDVESVGMISHLPFGGRGVNLGFVLPGEQAGSDNEGLKAELRVISPDYFEAMSIPVKSGRAFTDQDTKAAPRVLLVNEAFARLFFRSRSPIGQRLQIIFGSPFNGEIIGIAGDVRHRGYDADARPEMYLSYLQNTLWPVMNLVVRTRSDPGVIAPVVRREIEAVDRSQAVFNVRPLDGMLSDSIAGRRFNVLLILSFSLVAVLTAAVGLYGLMSYLVTQQAADIGIRMALGARSRDVLRLVLGHGMKLTGIGVGAGLFSGAFVTRLLASLLFGVSPLDPVAFVSVALFLALVSLIACSVPALNASRIDPLTIIREQ